MKILLLIVSWFFSALFFHFYKLSEEKRYILESLSGNLLIESIFFLSLASVFYFYFSNKNIHIKKVKTALEIWTPKNMSLFWWILFYIFFIYYSFIIYQDLDRVDVSLVAVFILGELLYLIASIWNNKQLLFMKYWWYLLHILLAAILVFTIWQEKTETIIYIILVYYIIFHIKIFILYKNYISLLMAWAITIFFIYYLYLYLNNLL